MSAEDPEKNRIAAVQHRLQVWTVSVVLDLIQVFIFCRKRFRDLHIKLLFIKSKKFSIIKFSMLQGVAQRKTMEQHRERGYKRIPRDSVNFVSEELNR